MKIDLHSHSTCSDGTYTPSQLMSLVKEANIDMFALTDHDTVLGLDEAKQQAKMLGIQLIDGVEISCRHTLVGGYGKHQALSKIIHVVALGFKDVAKLQSILVSLQHSREQRGKQIVERLSHILMQDKIGGIDPSDLWQLVLQKAGNNPKAVGRAHIGQALLDMGVVKSVQEAFDKFLADGKRAYVEIQTMTMEQTIDLIHECDGLAVLAHPTRYNLSATRVRRLIADFAQFGGDALELPSPSEPISTRAMIDRCVAQHNLLVSVGSDFHGSNMPWRKLGHVATISPSQTGVWTRLIEAV